MSVQRLSSELVTTKSGSNLQEELYKQIQGTDSLRDSVTPGTLDVLFNLLVPNPKDLRYRSFTIPEGIFTATRTLRTRGLSAEDPKYTKFDLRGQGSNLTRLVHPPFGSGGVGDSIYVDYLKDAHISGFFVDNTPLGSGSSNADTRNGQFWIRKSSDSEFSDLRFAGGDALTFCLDECVNIVAKDLKVDYQLRYPVGTGKSPLIVGDNSKQCMFIGGYVKSVSPDGSIKYAGDLADNDQALDTKWAFINLYGLKYSEKANSNACMWQEGQLGPSNAHFFGMNYIGNGLGHGTSEQSLGTTIGCTYRESQVRAVWNRAEYISLGGHYISNLGENVAGTGGAGAAPTGAIHNDNSRFTASIGEHFRNNYQDYSDYTGASAANVENSAHFVGSKLSAAIRLNNSSTARHLSIVNCQLGSGAMFTAGGNSLIHASVIGSHVIGTLGTFGNGSVVTNLDIIGSTFDAGGYTDFLVTRQGVGAISFHKSVIRDYQKIASGATGVIFDSCTFVTCTFTENDLNARYINCRFISCTNAPDVRGRNFMASSSEQPASARTTVTLAAGDSFTFPSWVHIGRGAYRVTVAGSTTTLPSVEVLIRKKAATGVGAPTVSWESDAGAISVTWPANGYITVTVNTTGTYSIAVS